VQRIPFPDVESLPETMRKMLEGTPLNVVRIGALASPAMFEAQGKLGYAVADPAVLDPKQREAAILRVAHLSNSVYELHHHIPLARAAGLSEAEIAAIGTQDYAALDPLLASVCRFADEVVVEGNASDATLAELRGMVADQVVINLVLAIGCYMSIARLIAVTGIAPDEAALEKLASSIDDPAR
jgi:alkylhydroperoxidase family enzyme